MILKPMSEMCAGESGVICSVDAKGALRRHFAKLGILCGAEVRCVGKAPFGDPLSYRIENTVLAFRSCDAEKIQVKINL